MYQESLKIYRDNFNVTKTLIEESVQAGIKRGIEQGIEQGIERVARQMKIAGLPIQDIAKFTGLSSEEIESLED